MIFINLIGMRLPETHPSSNKITMNISWKNVAHQISGLYIG